jgi:hypothetical protein
VHLWGNEIEKGEYANPIVDCLNIGLVQKEGLTPPDPIEMMGGIDSDEDDCGISTIGGLRMNAGESYVEFCEHFMPCVCTDEDWKRHSKNTRISSFIEASLEAFGIVTYVNGYEVWKSRYKEAGKEGDDVSSLTTNDDGSGDTRSFKYTGNARGSRKYAGWSPDGMKIHNKVVEVLSEQREKEESGSKFDDRVLQKLAMKRKRSRGYGESNAAPRARNNLEKLMRLA